MGLVVIIFVLLLKYTNSTAGMSAFWWQTISVKQVQDGLAGVAACPSESASPLFQPSLWKLSQIWVKKPKQKKPSDGS